MTANVSLILDKRDDILVVPNSAFRFKPVTGQSVEVGPPGPGRKSNIAAVTAPAVYLLGDKDKPVKPRSSAELRTGRTPRSSQVWRKGSA